MQPQVYFLALLTQIDLRLDEFEEDFGDLPKEINVIKEHFDKQKAIVKETEDILSDVKKFAKNSEVTLKVLKDKEKKLTDQQFSVRNNKEFDAITKEIEHTKQEYSRITSELRTVGVKEENLVKTLEEQTVTLKEVEKELKEKNKELSIILNDQNEDVKKLRDKREYLVKQILKENLDTYEIIRPVHKDAVVMVKKFSCTGCFSAVPPQKVVTMRTDIDKVYACENCGRIIYTEEIIIDDLDLDL
jgi:uncharacterized protein